MQLFNGKHSNYSKRFKKKKKIGSAILKNPYIVSHSETVKCAVGKDTPAKNIHACVAMNIRNVVITQDYKNCNRPQHQAQISSISVD